MSTLRIYIRSCMRYDALCSLWRGIYGMISTSRAYATSMTSVRLSVTLMDCDRNKKWILAHDRIDLSLGNLHAEADPDRSILSPVILNSTEEEDQFCMEK